MDSVTTEKTGMVLTTARRALAGALSGLVATFYLVSFVNLLVGPVAPAHVGTALWFALVASIAASAIAILRPVASGVFWQAQAITVVTLHAPATEIGRALQGAPPEAALATLAALLSLTAVLAGVAMALVGFLRGGTLGKAVPHPVLGAFLAATGVMLIARAVSGGPLSVTGWTAPEATATRALPFLLAIAAFAATRAGRSQELEPAALIVGAVLAVLLSSVSLPDSALSGVPAMQLPVLAGPISWELLLKHFPAAATAAGLAVLSAMMNLTSLERTPGEAVVPDAELRNCLPGNLTVAALSGIVTFPSYSLTCLAWSIDPRPGRLGIVAATLAIAGVLLAGTDFLTQLPQELFSFLLCFLGISILHRWLWVERRRMPLPDTILMLAILGITLAYGFGIGIAAGVVAGAIRFTLAYARLPVLRASYDARLRLSSTERAADDTRRLVDNGAETGIVHLAGYLFFGSAQQIETALADASKGAERRRVLVDLSAVRGVDISATESIHQAIHKAQDAGCHVTLCGMSPTIAADVDRAARGSYSVARNLDAALLAAEEEVLRVPPAAGPETGLLHLLDRIEARNPDLPFQRRVLEPGDALYCFGEPSDSFAFLEAGEAVATIGTNGPDPRQVALFRPGAVIGEIGFLTGGHRTANVTAISPCTFRVVGRDAIARLKGSDPEDAIALLERLGSLLAQRLARTTSLLHIYDHPPRKDLATRKA